MELEQWRNKFVEAPQPVADAVISELQAFVRTELIALAHVDIVNFLTHPEQEKEKALAGRVNEQPILERQFETLEKTFAICMNRKIHAPAFRWVREECTAALRAVEQTHFTDWTPLLTLATGPLPTELQLAFPDAMETVRNVIEAKMKAIPPCSNEYWLAVILREMSDKLFAPIDVELGITRSSDCSFSPGIVSQKIRFPFQEEILTCRFLMDAEEGIERDTLAYADPDGQNIVLWQTPLVHRVLDQRKIASGDFSVLQEMHDAGETETRINAIKEWAQADSTLFFTEAEHVTAYLNRVVYEELRHCMDHRRLLRQGRGYEGTGFLILRADAPLKTEFWDGFDLEREDIDVISFCGQVIVELSGQMTAAAAEPAMILHEWIGELQKSESDETPHKVAAELGVLLLAHERGLVQTISLHPHPSILEPLLAPLRSLLAFAKNLFRMNKNDAQHIALVDQDYPRLTELAKILAAQAEENPADMRLSLKNAYHRSFLAEIDEKPLFTIAADGSRALHK